MADKAGRKKKFTPIKKAGFIEAVMSGNTIASICEAMGIDPSTYRKERLADPTFAEAVDEAKCVRDGYVEDALYANALAGNVTSQIFYLCNRMPDRWKNIQKQQVDLTSGGEKMIGLVEIVKDYGPPPKG